MILYFPPNGTPGLAIFSAVSYTHLFHPSDCKSHLGRVLNIDDEGVYIKRKDGYLILKKLYNSGNEYLAKEIINKIGIKIL